MKNEPTYEELQEFLKSFDEKILNPLTDVGYDRYNVFDVLNINRQELRHSDFLAFLFNPNRSGNIGWQFLQNFLTLLQKNIPLNIPLNDLQDNATNVRVYREIKNIDILISFEIKEQKVVVVIENKVDSEQHDNQLERYQDFIFKNYNKHKKILLYLTPNKASPENENWTPIDYGLIYKALCEIDITNANETLKILIKDYKYLIRSQFNMMDNNRTELEKLALQIYEEKRTVLDFLYKFKPDWVKEVSRLFCSLLGSRTDVEIVKDKKGKLVKNNNRENKQIMFVTDALKEKHPAAFFQVDVKDLFLSLYEIIGTYKYKTICSFQIVDDKIRKDEIIETFESKIVADDEMEKICSELISHLFESDGIIDKCLNIIEINKK